jgi:hypothetical protein
MDIVDGVSQQEETHVLVGMFLGFVVIFVHV